MSTKVTITVHIETAANGSLERTTGSTIHGDNPALVFDQTKQALRDIEIELHDLTEAAFGPQHHIGS